MTSACVTVMCVHSLEGIDVVSERHLEVYINFHYVPLICVLKFVHIKQSIPLFSLFQNRGGGDGLISCL